MAALGVVGVFFAVVAVLALVALAIAIFQWLWNITMPDVFGLSPVTFWQAFRLILIASILFGGPAAAGSG